MLNSSQLRERRKIRQRYKIRQVSTGRPRLCINRTNQHMYAQIIDDATGVVIASASTTSKLAKASLKNGADKKAASWVGEQIAHQGISKGVQAVVFDRSGLIYHGRVKSLADSAREHGLVF